MPALTGTYSFAEEQSWVEYGDAEDLGYDVRTFNHQLGCVSLIGHCLAPDEAVYEAIEKAAYTNDDRELTYLSGSYATVVNRRDSVTVLADLANHFPIYYSEHDNLVTFSTSCQKVAENHGMLPSKHGLAMYVLGEVHPLGQNTTAFQGVNRLPGAHRLDVSRQGTAVSLYDDLAPNPTISREHAIHAVREALVQAVSGRLATEQLLSSDLSGGFDSTALTLLAASMLQGDQIIDGFHGSYAGSATSRDFEYAQLAANLEPRIRLHTVALPWRSILKPEDISTTFLRSIALKHGEAPTLHMTGEGGDALFHSTGTHMLDLWRAKKIQHFPRLLREVMTQATLSHRDPKQIFERIRQASRVSYEEALSIFDDDPSGASYRAPWLTVDGGAWQFLSPAARRNVAQVMQSRKAMLPDANIGVADFRTINDLQITGLVAATARQRAAAEGLYLHAPYLDHQVIRACLQLSVAQRYSTTQFKTVLVEALEGLVPSAVFNRTSKGDTVHEEFTDMRAHAPELRELLGRNSLLARLGIIDADTIPGAIAKAEFGARTAPLRFISKAVSAEQWLRDMYHAPDQRRVKPQLRNKSAIRQLGRVQVPPYVRLAQDEGGLVMYNLQTKLMRSMHDSTVPIIQSLHDGVGLQDSTLSQEVVDATMENLIEEGFLIHGKTAPFTINKPHGTARRAYDTPTQLGKIDTSGLKLNDYLRVAPALVQASRTLKHHSLWQVAESVTALKRDLAPSHPERVRRLMVAAHVLGRHYIARAACQELSLAVVLAEAKAGRAVDWVIGMAPDPRRIHAWPQVDGEPIQTPYDEVTDGTLTPFGIW